MHAEYIQLFTISWGLWSSSCEKKNEGALWLVVFVPCNTFVGKTEFFSVTNYMQDSAS